MSGAWRQCGAKQGELGVRSQESEWAMREKWSQEYQGAVRGHGMESVVSLQGERENSAAFD